MIASFRLGIQEPARQEEIWKTKTCCIGLVYTVVCFCDSLRGSEGLNMDLNLIKRYISEGGVQYGTPNCDVSPNIVISLVVDQKVKAVKGVTCYL